MTCGLWFSGAEGCGGRAVGRHVPRRSWSWGSQAAGDATEQIGFGADSVEGNARTRGAAILVCRARTKRPPKSQPHAACRTLSVTLFDGMAITDLMCFPLPLPIVCRRGRKRDWEARQIHPSCAEGRVAANGPQGRYAPRRAGRDGGMLFLTEHRDGSADEVIDIPMSFHVHHLPRVERSRTPKSRANSLRPPLGGQNPIEPPSLPAFTPH
jgi:hypothetical protein